MWTTRDWPPRDRNATGLITRMKYPTVAAQAIEEKQMQPTIMVQTRPSGAMPRDTECQGRRVADAPSPVRGASGPSG